MVQVVAPNISKGNLLKGIDKKNPLKAIHQVNFGHQPAVECCAQKLYDFHFSRMISFLPAHLTCQKTSHSKKMKT